MNDHTLDSFLRLRPRLRGIAYRMLGSVTLDLVQDAPVPVTVVHPPHPA